jgi:predicted metal-dependent HD superfamily phosphohydrolase
VSELVPAMFTEEHLATALRQLRGGDAAELFLALASAYAEPARHYHNARHVAESLALAREHRHLAIAPAELELAIWFHDAVYEPKATDNEERSAAWARRALEIRSVPAEAVRRIETMILATKTHPVSDGDTALMLDIDLGILGAPPARFDAYDKAIGLEYAWVEPSLYRQARSSVLAGILQRPFIFQTAAFRRRFETTARANLARALQALDARAPQL